MLPGLLLLFLSLPCSLLSRTQTRLLLLLFPIYFFLAHPTYSPGQFVSKRGSFSCSRIGTTSDLLGWFVDFGAQLFLVIRNKLSVILLFHVRIPPSCCWKANKATLSLPILHLRIISASSPDRMQACDFPQFHLERSMIFARLHATQLYWKLVHTACHEYALLIRQSPKKTSFFSSSPCRVGLDISPILISSCLSLSRR